MHPSRNDNGGVTESCQWCCLDELSGKCLKEVPLQADLSGGGQPTPRCGQHMQMSWGGVSWACAGAVRPWVWLAEPSFPEHSGRLWGRVASCGGGPGSFLEFVRCPQRVLSKGMACCQPTLLTPPGKSQFSESYLDVTLPGALRGFALTVGWCPVSWRGSLCPCAHCQRPAMSPCKPGSSHARARSSPSSLSVPGAGRFSVPSLMHASTSSSCTVCSHRPP